MSNDNLRYSSAKIIRLHSRNETQQYASVTRSSTAYQRQPPKHSTHADQLWSDRYKPTCIDHLTLPRKKVEEIHVALENSNVLVIQGPTSSGKRCGVDVVAHNLGYSVTEWQLPPYSTRDNSLIDTFLHFLTSKYSSVPVSHGYTARRPAKPTRDDVSYSLYVQENPSYRSCVNTAKRYLYNYASSTDADAVVLVFILGEELCDNVLYQTMFSSLKSLHRFSYIKILKPTSMGLKRVWKRILATEGISSTQLKTEQNNMDFLLSSPNLNRFLVDFQFNFIPPVSSSIDTGHILTQSSSLEQHALNGQVDHQIMHIAARLLWNKRIPRSQVIDARNDAASGSGIYLTSLNHASCGRYAQHDTESRSKSSCVVQQLTASEMIPKIQRPPVYYDIEHMLDSVESELSTIVSILYSNFPYFFGDVVDAAELLDQFAYADAFLRFCTVTRNRVCIRIILDTNLHPTSPYSNRSVSIKGAVENDTLKKRPTKGAWLFSLQNRKLDNVLKRKEALLCSFLQQDQSRRSLDRTDECDSVSHIIKDFRLQPRRGFAFFIDILPMLSLFTQKIDNRNDIMRNATPSKDNRLTLCQLANENDLEALEIDEFDLEPEDDIENLDF